MNKPREITLAVVALWATLAVGALYNAGFLLLVVFTVPTEKLPPGFIATTTVMYVIFLGLGALTIHYLARGYGWPRWIFVIGLLSIVGLLLMPNSARATAAMPFATTVQYVQLVTSALAVRGFSVQHHVSGFARSGQAVPNQSMKPTERMFDVRSEPDWHYSMFDVASRTCRGLSLFL